MLMFLIGFITAWAWAGSFGYTWDRFIVSGRPFKVDNELYQCTYVGHADKKGN